MPMTCISSLLTLFIIYFDCYLNLLWLRALEEMREWTNRKNAPTLCDPNLGTYKKVCHVYVYIYASVYMHNKCTHTHIYIYIYICTRGVSDVGFSIFVDTDADFAF